MAKRIYLEGGERQETDVYVDLEKNILDSVNEKTIFILDFARYGDEIIRRKEKDKKYFESLGATKIEFATGYFSSEEIIKQINDSNILYLVGGSTEFLLEKIREKNLVPVIESYEGIIIGNSAGAYACCKEYFRIRDEGVKVIPSLGLVDFSCEAHYTNEFDSQLLELSNEGDIYGIPEGSAIVVEGNKLNFIKDVYLFSKGEKTKVN